MKREIPFDEVHPGAVLPVFYVVEYGKSSRSIAKKIKDPKEEETLNKVADSMAALVKKHARAGKPPVFVPAPSSVGGESSMDKLAQMVAFRVGGTVVYGVDRHKPIQSSYLARKEGLRIPDFFDQLDTLALGDTVPEERTVWLVDNVVTSGNTLKASAFLLDLPDIRGLVYSSVEGPRHKRNPTMPQRVCISGSRSFRDLERVRAFVETLPVGTVVIHGGAEGVDKAADAAARLCGLSVEVVRPEWNKHGRAAGPIRNRAMVESCDYLVAFWDGLSKGTKSAIDAAKRLDKEFDVVLDAGTVR